MASSERLRKLEELFLLATEFSGRERAAFLDRHCADDAALRRELEALLLQDDEGTKEFLRGETASNGEEARGAARHDASEDEWLPERVGAFRLVEPIGEGGMGIVWLAEQEEPVRRRVAIKFIKLGTRKEGALERFEAERQALAWMNHPAIARIFDGGAIDRGVPWFAMEYAPGAPVDAFCDEHRLPLDERLALFVRVCDAVQHAHQKGIIHCDLKPGNILVSMQDGAPTPKLIDFGVAHAMSRRSPALDARGVTSPVTGTFAYMSPEQASVQSADIDARADIYSLGVILYVLLVGDVPFDTSAARGQRLEEIAELLAARTIEPPSERFLRLFDREPGRAAELAAARSTDPRSVARALRGDLDWIVAAAVASDREQRYATAAELAADLRRHMRHEPVLVAPADWAYRLERSIRRRRWAYLSGALLAAALLVGVLGIVWGLFEARRGQSAAQEAHKTELALRADAQAEAERAMAVTRFLVAALSMADPSVVLSRDVTVHSVLVATSERTADAFRGDPISEVLVRRTVGQAFHSLGDVERAEAELRRALEICETTSEVSVVEMVDTMWALAQVFNESAGREGYELGCRALRLMIENLNEVEPALGVHLEDVWPVLTLNAAAAREPFGEFVELAESTLVSEDPTWRLVADIIGFFGYQESYFWGSSDEATVLLEGALRMRRRAWPKGHPEVARNLGQLAGTLAQSGRFVEAEERAREALAIYEATLPEGHWLIANARSQLGECLIGQGHSAEAGALLLESHAALRTSRGSSSAASLRATRRLVLYLDQTGQAADGDRHRAELRGAYAFSKSAPIHWGPQRVAFGPETSALVQALDELDGAVLDFVRAVPVRPTPPASLGPALERVLELRAEHLTDDDPRTIIVARQLVEWAFRLQPFGCGGDQERMNEEGLRLLEPQVERIPHCVADALMGLGLTAFERGDMRAAERLCGEARAIFREAFGELSYSSLTCESYVAQSLSGQQRYEEAERCLWTVWDKYTAAVGVFHPAIADLRRAIEQLDREWHGEEGARDFDALLAARVSTAPAVER